MKNRIERINELLKEELGNIIEQEIDLESGSMITITKVDTSKDLRYSRVLVSILPDGKSGSSFRLLTKQIYQIQQLLNKRLSMKPVPKIRFDMDTGGKHYTELEKLIQKIETEEPK